MWSSKFEHFEARRQALNCQQLARMGSDQRIQENGTDILHTIY